MPLLVTIIRTFGPIISQLILAYLKRVKIQVSFKN